MCEQSGTHQQGPFILDEDQNHVFQRHIVVTLSAIVCFIVMPLTFKFEKVKSF